MMRVTRKQLDEKMACFLQWLQGLWRSNGWDGPHKICLDQGATEAAGGVSMSASRLSDIRTAATLTEFRARCVLSLMIALDEEFPENLDRTMVVCLLAWPLRRSSSAGRQRARP